MLADHVLVGRAIDAVELVVRDVAVDPLDLRSEVRSTEHDVCEAILRSSALSWPDAGHFPLDHELGHDKPSDRST